MATKTGKNPKLSINTDSGALSKDAIPKLDESPANEQSQTSSEKNRGGRPKKDGLKNEQFTLTMNPEKYEKLKLIANEYTNSNFSRLIDEAINAFCSEKGINLADVKVDPEIIKLYREKQKKKQKKK